MEKEGTEAFDDELCTVEQDNGQSRGNSGGLARLQAAPGTGKRVEVQDDRSEQMRPSPGAAANGLGDGVQQRAARCSGIPSDARGG